MGINILARLDKISPWAALLIYAGALLPYYLVDSLNYWASEQWFDLYEYIFAGVALFSLALFCLAIQFAPMGRLSKAFMQFGLSMSMILAIPNVAYLNQSQDKFVASYQVVFGHASLVFMAAFTMYLLYSYAMFYFWNHRT